MFGSSLVFNTNVYRYVAWAYLFLLFFFSLPVLPIQNTVFKRYSTWMEILEVTYLFLHLTNQRLKQYMQTIPLKILYKAEFKPQYYQKN
jgi:hypothetical protein